MLSTILPDLSESYQKLLIAEKKLADTDVVNLDGRRKFVEILVSEFLPGKLDFYRGVNKIRANGFYSTDPECRSPFNVDSDNLLYYFQQPEGYKETDGISTVAFKGFLSTGLTSYHGFLIIRQDDEVNIYFNRRLNERSKTLQAELGEVSKPLFEVPENYRFETYVSEKWRVGHKLDLETLIALPKDKKNATSTFDFFYGGLIKFTKMAIKGNQLLLNKASALDDHLKQQQESLREKIRIFNQLFGHN